MWLSNSSIIIQTLTPIFIIIFGILLGFLIENRLKKFRKKLDNNDLLAKYSVILRSFEGVIFIWFIVGTIALILPSLNLPTPLNILLQKIIIVIALFMATILASRLAVSAIHVYSKKSKTTVSLTSLFEYLTKVIIFSIGFLIIIQSIGIQITALITAFGVGSLSIGLAFQNTLSNLISGVNIIVSGKIRPRDYIEFKSGEEGYVIDVELKYTLIKDIFNNIIVIPNRQIIDASFKNYTLENSWMLLPIKIVINYDSDLEKVEQITLQIAKQILENIDGGCKEFEPFLRYDNFDYYGINLTVYLKIHEYLDRLLITHEFIKKIYKIYQQENITLAYPLVNPYLKINKSIDD
ncbi:small-conductance mechanosensitive channel [Geminocystis sp. NIES-3708]|uniref:mechanosensitive ion channel family protein n=1 Tax=Geminocystis sp. NIES-3708 TaxID=1615909 RepID=UPI0005FCB393|nr:mechanosensitive ion channel family protein [Geminocystis sp. NIES-3708]BAQ60959.1 small-conductance mechanosensitive channel [Geminocystis sp. NIES-3708]